ncbi:MAG: TIGR03668 family PPOX class F420-dependent oxidoreductase, partial [Pseudonocardiaceae bacterium]
VDSRLAVLHGTDTIALGVFDPATGELTDLDLPYTLYGSVAVDGDIVLTAVDAKPKRTRRLRRLANIAAHPEVCLLVDHYADDWDVLWWVRADGRAVVRRTAPQQVLELLVGKYPQYRQIPPQGPFVLVDVTTWRGWSAR